MAEKFYTVRVEMKTSGVVHVKASSPEEAMQITESRGFRNDAAHIAFEDATKHWRFEEVDMQVIEKATVLKLGDT